MNKEERRSFVNNIEYIPYIQLDNEQKQMISDFVKDYDNLQSQLDIANKKLDKIKELTDKEKQIFIHDYSCITPSNLEAKLWNNHGTEFMDELLSIIGGE